DGDATTADDFALRQKAVFADDELGARADGDRALLEAAVDVHRAASFELERGVAQHVAFAEIASVGWRCFGFCLERNLAGHRGHQLGYADALSAGALEAFVHAARAATGRIT